MRAAQNAATKEHWGEPRPLPDSIRHGRCPKCGKRMAIERVPFSKHWEVFCLTCSRFSLPDSYDHFPSDFTTWIYHF